MQQIRTLLAVLVAFVGLAFATDDQLLIRNGGGKGGGKIAKTTTAAVNLVVGAGWYPFLFGFGGTQASSNFVFSTSETTLLQVTDEFCTGDSFIIYDNGLFLGQTNGVDASCENWTDQPFAAYYSSGWSSFNKFIPAGNHNITIGVIASPFGGGSGAIRVDYNFGTPIPLVA